MQHIAAHPPFLEIGLRWVARITGLLVLGIFLAFALGEGIYFTLLSRSEAIMLTALAISLAGIAVGWRAEAPGGALNVAGLLAFYMLNFAASGRFPSGPVLPLTALPGVLYLICWWRHKAT